MMMSAQTEFRERLEKKLRDGIQSGGEELVAGGAYVPDFANYQFRVGFLKALQQCLDLCGEVEAEMNL